MRGIYLAAAIVSFAIVVVLVRLFCRRHFGQAVTLLFVFAPYVLLGMVRIRCKFERFNCGWMSFGGGITWHVLPSAIVIGLIAYVIHRLRLTEAVKPLGGAWLGLLWYALPISVIHPPSHGGPCPSLPIICHDLPFLGLGGLFYWLLPFVLWAAFLVAAQASAQVRA